MSVIPTYSTSADERDRYKAEEKERFLNRNILELNRIIAFRVIRVSSALRADVLWP